MNLDQVPSLFLACGAGRPRPAAAFPAIADPESIANFVDARSRHPVITTLFPAMLQAPAGSAVSSEP